jgi:alginate O-acetyltransferase complex protein AlgI
MDYTSYSYLFFLFFAVSLYWGTPDRFRKCFLLISSYLFYFLGGAYALLLLLAVTLFNYFYAPLIARYRDRKILAIGISINLLPLIYFKYLSFLISNLGLGLLLPDVDVVGSRAVLPLGISFFTFQTICYQIEVYGGLPVVRGLTDFALYVAIWPKLIAGPIVRPDAFAEQLLERKIFKHTDIKIGTHRILHGLFKKIVIADNLAPIVDSVFLPTQNSLGWIDCSLGSVAFGLQIYFDFSAYSDIAIGSARLLGYEFPENFAYPYRAHSFSDFWSKWHITLSSWIRDYVYMPLAMSFGGKRTAIYAIMIVSMIIMGFWHGAKWTFILWGIWHGLMLVVQYTIGKNLFSSQKGARAIIATILTYLAVNIGWLFFKADSLEQIVRMLTSLFMLKGGLSPLILKGRELSLIFLYMLGLMLWMILSEPVQDFLVRYPEFGRRAKALEPIYYVVVIFTIVIMERTSQSFIYFKF